MKARLERTPVPLPWRRIWGLDFEIHQRIFVETGVTIGLRQRPQWGDDWYLVGSGPALKLEEAVQMAKARTCNTTTIIEPTIQQPPNKPQQETKY